MKKEICLSLGMDSMLDNFAEYRKNKVMIIDANTGQGKTSAAIKWIGEVISDKSKLPEGIEEVKVFYFTPQKNAWPTGRVFEDPKTKKKSAFLFSQKDTFEYIIKQYKGKSNKEKTIDEFYRKLTNKDLEYLVSKKSKKNIRLLDTYEDYKESAFHFANLIMSLKTDNENLNKTFNKYTINLKALVRELYGNNYKTIKSKLMDKNNKALSFLYDLYSSMLIFDNKYNLFISSVDKILYPLETILFGQIYIDELKRIFGEKTLIIMFIDEWDDAYDRFALYNYKKSSEFTFDIFEIIRALLQINEEFIPNYYKNLRFDLKKSKDAFLSKYPKAGLDLEVSNNIKAFMGNEIEISNSDNQYFSLVYNDDKNTNEIKMTNNNNSLHSFIMSAIKYIETNIKIIKANTKNDGELNYILKFLGINKFKFIDDIMKSQDYKISKFILLESRKNKLLVTPIITNAEKSIERIIFEGRGLSPTLLVGMSATAKYKTVINNFNLKSKEIEEHVYNIPEKISEYIKREYIKCNNYDIKDNDVKEYVISVGSKWEDTNTNKEIRKIILNNEEETKKKLTQILRNKKECELIFREMAGAIEKTDTYTLKNILSMTTALTDAKSKDVKNMMVFSTNSYQKEEHRILIKYIYVLKLIEKNVLKDKNQVIETLKNDIVFINAESFKNKSDILNKLNNDTCYIITSYMSSSRGVNLIPKIKKEYIDKDLVGKIDPNKENPKIGEKIDIQAIYLEKPTYVVPQIPTRSKKFGDEKMIEAIGVLTRLFQAGSINQESFSYWIGLELGLPNKHNIQSQYPGNSMDGKIAAIKTAVQAIGRRTRTPYRFKNCITYINHEFLIGYPWEFINDYISLFESEQINKIIETKKALL